MKVHALTLLIPELQLLGTIVGYIHDNDAKATKAITEKAWDITEHLDPDHSLKAFERKVKKFNEGHGKVFAEIEEQHKHSPRSAGQEAYASPSTGAVREAQGSRAPRFARRGPLLPMRSRPQQALTCVKRSPQAQPPPHAPAGAAPPSARGDDHSASQIASKELALPPVSTDLVSHLSYSLSLNETPLFLNLNARLLIRL
jgi:hypothetical protein